MAGLLTELLLHGQDLADITGRSVEFTRDHALAAIPAMLTLAPAFVDAEAAAKCAGTFHLKFRGGDHWTFAVADGALTVTPTKPDKADAHINADPAAFILSSMGRMSDVRAGLTGKVVGYGRKPWMLAKLGSLRIEGV